MFHINSEENISHRVNKTFLQPLTLKPTLNIINLPKTKNFDCVGKGDLTSLLFSKIAKYIEVRGDLSRNVEDTKFYYGVLLRSFTTEFYYGVLLVDRQSCKSYAALVLCTLKNSKFIYENIKLIF